MTPGTNKPKKHLSVLSRRATGGDIADEGFSYQESVMLSHIPAWLANDGFHSCLREGLEDIEAKFFVPGQGFVKERIQVKHERVIKSLFDGLIQSFKEIYDHSPTSYRWFTLVIRDLADELKPLESGLRRIRGSYKFYRDDEAVVEASYGEYLARARKLGYSDEHANFLFAHVLIDTNAPDPAHAQGIFGTAVDVEFPEYTDISANIHREMFEQTKLLIQGRKNEEIHRKELEQTIRSVIPTEIRPLPRPITLFTAGVAEEPPPNALHFAWEPFFGGNEKQFPPTTAWNETLVGQLQATRDWIAANRRTEGVPTHLHLTGSRRLSTAFAIGHVFRAVTGFSIEMNHKGTIWATNQYATRNSEPYQISLAYQDSPSDHLVVSISIPPKDITTDVEQFVAAQDGKPPAMLHIKGEGVIESSGHADTATNAIKSAILQTLASTPRQRIHLFYAGPSFLALFLGHRMNAIGDIQCYEFVSSNQYVPTCTLLAK